MFEFFGRARNHGEKFPKHSRPLAVSSIEMLNDDITNEVQAV